MPDTPTTPNGSPLVPLRRPSAFPTRKVLTLIGFFAALFLALFLIMRGQSQLQTAAQQFLYPMGFSLLLSGLATLWLGMKLRVIDSHIDDDNRFFPILAALLSVVIMALAYAWVGMWPVGGRSAMIVDMHHQYAPLLAQLRHMILGGENALYSFEVGMGASFLPLYAYYLASPFNLLLCLFSETYLTEAILLITLLKNMITAGLMAAALQYIYGKRTYAIPIAAILYSLSTYMLAYSWNIMWLDCLMVLPLVLLGFEKLMREGKYLTYVLSLGYLLFCNYYIGFMCCVFLVLYYVAFVCRRKREGREIGASFVRFALGSLIGGLLSFVLLVPVIMALGQTSAAGGSFREFEAMFPMWKLLRQCMFGNDPTIRSGNLPNMYSGILAVFLLPVYATTSAIPLRHRLSNLGLLGVIALSMTVNNTDLFWHGMHSPNDLPYRYSFLFTLVLVFITYEMLLHIRFVRGKQIGLSAAALIAYLVVEQYTTSGEDTEMRFLSIYISLGLILLYAALTAFLAHPKTNRRIATVLLLTVVTAEMLLGSDATLIFLCNNEYYTYHSAYVDNTITETLRQTVATMQELDQKENGENFYRMEFFPRRTCVDTSLYHYPGITVFASSNSYEETRMMGALGYAVNGVNSHLYQAFNPISDSLIGIKYIAADRELSAPLVKVDTIEHDGNTYHVYRNEQALSVGYMVDNNVRGWSYSYYNPMLSQQELIAAMTGIEDDLYAMQPIESYTATVSGTSSFNMSSGTSNFTCRLQSGGPVFLYVDCRAADSISVTALGASEGTDSWTVTPHEPYIISAGDLPEGTELSVSISSDMSCTGNVYVGILNESVYGAAMETLAKEQLTLTSFSDTRLIGTVDVADGGVMFTSIPYDAGWSVKVDGKAVDTFAAGEAMLAFSVGAGEHTVEITFFPRGLTVGILCTVVGVAALVLLVIFCRRRPDKRLSLAEPIPFADLEDEEVEAVTDEDLADEEEAPVADETPKPEVSAPEAAANESVDETAK